MNLEKSAYFVKQFEGGIQAEPQPSERDIDILYKQHILKLLVEAIPKETETGKFPLEGKIEAAPSCWACSSTYLRDLPRKSRQANAHTSGAYRTGNCRRPYR